MGEPTPWPTQAGKADESAHSCHHSPGDHYQCNYDDVDDGDDDGDGDDVDDGDDGGDEFDVHIILLEITFSIIMFISPFLHIFT